jgi:hypothetical protein
MGLYESEYYTNRVIEDNFNFFIIMFAIVWICLEVIMLYKLPHLSMVDTLISNVFLGASAFCIVFALFSFVFDYTVWISIPMKFIYFLKDSFIYVMNNLHIVLIAGVVVGLKVVLWKVFKK